MNKQDKQQRVKVLVERVLTEVRLPTGYFLVLARFMVRAQGSEWDSVFMTNEVVHLDPANKTIKGYSTVSKTWTVKDVSLDELRRPEIYKVFSQNTRKLTPAELQSKGFVDAVSFNTTVRAFPRRVEEFDLEPDSKINVKVVESINKK